MSAHLHEHQQRHQHYIGGTWTDAESSDRITVTNPATGEVIGTAAAGSAGDARRAIAAAQQAFAGWAATPAADRIAALRRIQAGLERRGAETAALITAQMGSPIGFSRTAQIGLPLRNLDSAARAMAAMEADEWINATLVQRAPLGVVGAITPWNFPLHQITAKVAPALAAGCTVVLKPSELTPLDACLFAEVVHEAGLPPGVFNLVLGTGPIVGEVLASDPAVRMVSFTGSTAAGLRVAALAAATLKKTTLELGGKSANILLDDADFNRAIPAALGQCFVNAGQTCAALTRLLVPAARLAEVEERLCAALTAWQPGDPQDTATRLGPVASRAQQSRVQDAIRGGIAQGARLLAGGAGPVPGLAHGAYVQPTLFSTHDASLHIVREEIFGPVLCVLPHAGEDDAVRLANDSAYGLSGGVWSADPARARAVASRLHTGQVSLNGAMLDVDAPFGGWGLSGLGREYGRYGLEEYFQTRALLGAA